MKHMQYTRILYARVCTMHKLYKQIVLNFNLINKIPRLPHIGSTVLTGGGSRALTPFKTNKIKIYHFFYSVTFKNLDFVYKTKYIHLKR